MTSAVVPEASAKIVHSNWNLFYLTLGFDKLPCFGETIALRPQWRKSSADRNVPEDYINCRRSMPSRA